MGVWVLQRVKKTHYPKEDTNSVFLQSVVSLQCGRGGPSGRTETHVSSLTNSKRGVSFTVHKQKDNDPQSDLSLTLRFPKTQMVEDLKSTVEMYQKGSMT